MAVTQSAVTTSATPTLLNAVTATAHPVVPGRTQYSWTSTSLIIQNVHATEPVYIGNASVTASTGIKLASMASVALDDLAPTEAIYAMSAAASSIVVLSIVR